MEGEAMLRQDDAFLRRSFHRSLLPCILSILSSNINILVDGIIVGQRIGIDGLSAISLCVPVYLVLCVVGSFIVSGSATQASRAIGRQDEDLAIKPCSSKEPHVSFIIYDKYCRHLPSFPCGMGKSLL